MFGPPLPPRCLLSVLCLILGDTHIIPASFIQFTAEDVCTPSLSRAACERGYRSSPKPALGDGARFIAAGRTLFLSILSHLAKFDEIFFF